MWELVKTRFRDLVSRILAYIVIFPRHHPRTPPRLSWGKSREQTSVECDRIEREQVLAVPSYRLAGGKCLHYTSTIMFLDILVYCLLYWIWGSADVNRKTDVNKNRSTLKLESLKPFIKKSAIKISPLTPTCVYKISKISWKLDHKVRPTPAHTLPH